MGHVGLAGRYLLRICECADLRVEVVVRTRSPQSQWSRVRGPLSWAGRAVLEGTISKETLLAEYKVVWVWVGVNAATNKTGEGERKGRMWVRDLRDLGYKREGNASGENPGLGSGETI